MSNPEDSVNSEPKFDSVLGFGTSGDCGSAYRMLTGDWAKIHKDKARIHNPYESDPHGIPTNAPGAKLDAGKVRVDLVFDGFALALREVAKVSTFGAEKYSEGGWHSVPDGVKRYRAAGDRHRLDRAAESHDPQSNLLHLAHECWNRLAELQLLLEQSQCSK